VPNEVLEEIAEYVADNSGDCRESLQILLRLGRKADRENRQKIEASHLMKK
jgi:cell division control protein 6